MTFVMKYQCPYCGSFDVRRNENGDVVCFECFSICSDKNVSNVSLNSSDLPPNFPQELERRKLRKKGPSSKDIMDFERFMRRVV